MDAMMSELFLPHAQEYHLYPTQESPLLIKQLCRYRGQALLLWDTSLYTIIHWVWWTLAVTQ